MIVRVIFLVSIAFETFVNCVNKVVGKVQVNGYRDESVLSSINGFASDQYGQSYVYKTNGDAANLWYGFINDMQVVTQELLDCRSVGFSTDFQSNVVCIFKASKDSPIKKNYLLKRYKLFLGDVNNYAIPSAATTDLPDLTLTPQVDWQIITTVRDWVHFIHVEPPAANAQKNVTKVRYYSVKLEFRANFPYSNFSSISGIEIQGNFTLKPYFKAVAGMSKTIIIMNTLNTTKAFNTTSQDANNELLFLNTPDDAVWSGTIFKPNLTEAPGNTEVKFIFDIEVIDTRLLVLFPAVNSTSPLTKNIEWSSFLLAPNITNNTLNNLTLNTTGLPNFPLTSKKVVVQMETSGPASFAHFARMKFFPTTSKSTYTQSMLLFLHLPKTVLNTKSSRTKVFWLDVNTTTLTDAGNGRVVVKPTDSQDDIRVVNYDPDSNNFNILHIDNEKINYIDYYAAYAKDRNYAAGDPRFKLGDIFVKRFSLYECKTAHVALQDQNNDFDRLNETVDNTRVFCNQYGIPTWLAATDNKNTYSIISQLPVTTNQISTTFTSTNLTIEDSQSSFDTYQLTAVSNPLATVYDLININISTPSLVAFKNSYISLPFYSTEIKGGNLTLSAMETNTEIEFKDFKTAELKFPKTIRGPDRGYDLDEVFPTYYGAIGSQDNQGLVFLICSETADFSSSMFNTDCKLSAHYSIPFVKVVSVKDLYAKCWQILIMARNISAESKDNEMIFISFNYGSHQFTKLGSLNDSEYYDIGCHRNGFKVSIFAAGWNYRSNQTTKALLWVDGNLASQATTNKSLAVILNSNYISSATFNLMGTNSDFYYYTFFNDYNGHVIVKSTYDRNSGFSASTNITRRFFLNNKLPLMCLFSNHYLTYLTPMTPESWIYVYNLETTKPFRQYYQIIKYRLADYNLTEVINVFCHQVSVVEAFTVYGKSVVNGVTHNIFLTFTIDDKLDQRLYSTINTTEIVSTVMAIDNLVNKAYLIVKQYQLHTKYYVIKFGDSLTMAHFKNVNLPSTLPATITLKMLAKNNYNSKSFDFKVTFENTNAVTFEPQTDLNYTENTNWTLVPGLLKSLQGSVLRMTVNGTGAKLEAPRLFPLKATSSPLPEKRNKNVSPSMDNDYDLNLEVIYIDFESVFYVFSSNSLIASCQGVKSNVGTIAIKFKIVKQLRLNRLWIVYAAADGHLFALSVDLPTDQKTQGICSNAIYEIFRIDEQLKLSDDPYKDSFTLIPYLGDDNKTEFYLSTVLMKTKEIVDYSIQLNTDDPDYWYLNSNIEMMQATVNSTAPAEYYKVDKILRRCCKVFASNYSLMYTVCLASDTETSFFNQVVVTSYHLNNSTQKMEAVYSKAAINPFYFGNSEFEFFCSILPNKTISCAIPNKLGNQIMQFYLQPPKACALANKYCFSVRPLLNYTSPQSYELNSIDISNDFLVAIYYKKNESKRLEEIELVVFKLGITEPYSSTFGGNYDNLASMSFSGGFFGMNNDIIYLFDARNITMQTYKIGEAVINFTAPSVVNLSSSLIFESAGQNPVVVNLNTLFKQPSKPNEEAPKVEKVAPPPPQKSFLEKNWLWITIVGSATVLVIGGGIGYFFIRREMLKNKVSDTNERIIYNLDDFAF